MKRARYNLMFSLALALVLVGCGPSSEGSSVKARGSDFTGKTKLPDATIGVLNVLPSSEVTKRWSDAAVSAIKGLGLKMVYADGKGDPAVWGQAVSGFVQQKVDGIVIVGGVQTGPIASQLKQAKSAGIPVVHTGIQSPDPKHLFAGTFAPNDATFGTVMADYMKKNLPSGSEWVTLEITADQGANAPIVSMRPIMEKAGYPRVGTLDLNISKDLVSQVTKGSTDLLRGHPKAKLLMACCDFSAGLTVPALEQSGHPTVIHALRYDNLTTLDLIRAGKPVVTAASNSDFNVMTAIDQLVANIATGKKFDETVDDAATEYTVIDKTNVPDKGYYYDPAVEVAKFVKKWKSEYSSK